MGGTCSTNGGEKRNAYRLLVGKSEGRRPLGRPRSTWVDNIKMVLEEIREGILIGLVWLRIGTNVVLNLRVP
jgi:hypothetical protein